MGDFLLGQHPLLYMALSIYWTMTLFLLVLIIGLDPYFFLTLENDELPGNLALRDQILVLEWIQENIKYFWGDPDKVTIAGE